MRTTLDLDDTVLAAARARARSQGVSLGRAVSDLALRGLRAQRTGHRGRFPLFDDVPEHVITDDLVEQHRDDG
ncbi:DUF2191 domain-containing protein [Georgenia yuyongxinii]